MLFLNGISCLTHSKRRMTQSERESRSTYRVRDEVVWGKDEVTAESGVSEDTKITVSVAREGRREGAQGFGSLI